MEFVAPLRGGGVVVFVAALCSGGVVVFVWGMRVSVCGNVGSWVSWVRVRVWVFIFMFLPSFKKILFLCTVSSFKFLVSSSGF